jgi:energy-converting hydrogenase Eha subunit C
MGHSGTFVLEEAPLMSQAERVLGNILELPSRSLMELEEARSAYFSELDASVEPAVDGLAVDKMPLNLLALPYIHSLFPDARVVLSQRHPCDAVLSCFMQGFALNSAMACFLDIADAAAAYDAIMTVWTRSREVLPLRVHTTVYEQLIDDPERELRALIDFLGLDWQDQLLDHRKTALGRGAIGTPSYDQVVQPLRASSISRWKNYEKQLEPVLPVLLPWAERLGYVD